MGRQACTPGLQRLREYEPIPDRPPPSAAIMRFRQMPDWPLTGWSLNREAQIAARNNRLQQIQEQMESPDTDVAVQMELDEEARQIRETARRFRSEWAAGLDAVLPNPPSDAEDEGDDVEQAPGSPLPSMLPKAKRKQSLALAAQYLQKDDPNDHEMPLAEGYRLFKIGCERAKIPKTEFSEYAYTQRIPELEDENPQGRAPFQLRPHQREALGWWLKLTAEHHCFLFADDMGLGKTAVAVARIKLRTLEQREGGKRKQTLVVSPLSLIKTWEAELARCPSLKVLCYHTGSGRNLTKAQLGHYDVIITTYDVLKNQYALLKNCQEDWLAILHGYKDVIEQAAREAQGLSQKKRKREGAWKLQERRVSAPLMSIEFEEMIIDEAHTIKELATQRASAACQVKAKSRVAITGTPVQNNYGDLLSLFCFLRYSPWDRKTVFKSFFTTQRRTAKSRMLRLSKDRELILAAVLAVIQLRREKGANFQGAPLTGVQPWFEFNQVLMLSEKEQEHQAATESLWDPRKRLLVDMESKKLAQEESKQPLTTAQKEAKKKREQEEVKAIFLKIILARVRAIHPELHTAKYSEAGEVNLEGRSSNIERDLALLSSFRNSDATINANKDAQIQASESDLRDKYSKSSGSTADRKQWDRNRAEFQGRMRNGGWQSCKMTPMIWTIHNIIESTKRAASRLRSEVERKEYIARNKVIVFSEFLSALDVVAIAVEEALGLQCLRFDGRCNIDQRETVKNTFEETGKDFSRPQDQPHHMPILLATTKAAAEGLTLVHARHVVFLAPCWNPYMEDQGIGRAARIGQTGQVQVYRFICAKSIEQYVADVNAVKRGKVDSLQNEARLLENMERMSTWTMQDFKAALEGSDAQSNVAEIAWL